VYSQITFSYFEDSGWYGIYDRSPIETLVWGKDRGCSFIEDCSLWPQSTPDDPGYRCSDPIIAQVVAPEECTFDLHAQGKCTDTKTNKDPSNPLLDSCTYIYTPEESRCDNPVNSFLFHNNVGELVGKTSRCFRANILKLTRQFTLPTTPGIDLTHCYNSTCQSRTQLKVGVAGIWYDCPYEGGEVSPIGYGGSIKCIPKAADRVCLDAPTDDNWPTITGVFPETASPNDVITIYGTNFLATPTIVVFLIRGDKAACDSVFVENDTALNCTLSDGSGFATLTDVAASLNGPVAISILVSDGQGRTDLLVDGIQIWINTENAIQDFAQKYPYWVAVIAIVLFVLLVLVIIGIMKFVGFSPTDYVNM